MAKASAENPRGIRSEQIILFRIAGQLFAISSASVQEVRGVDTLAGSSSEISVPGLKKVRRFVHRGDKSLFVVNGAAHFGLPQTPGALVFVLRRTHTALLVDGIDKMTSMTRLQSLPNSFCHEERHWYRGLTALDQTVIPVVSPDGFLTSDEITLLDSAVAAHQTAIQGEPPTDSTSTAQIS
jgi:chemotaxis signal transduction protein